MIGLSTIFHWDLIAAVFVAAGATALIFIRRLPPGLSASLFVALMSAAAAILSLAHFPREPLNVSHVMTVSAALCLAWSAVGLATARRNAVGAGPAIPDNHPLSFADCCFAGSLTTGVIAVTLIVFTITYSTLYRLLSDEPAAHAVRWEGAADLASILLATMFWRLRRAHTHQPVVVLLLTWLLLTWFCLLIPAVGGGYATAEFSNSSQTISWWAWLVQWQTSCAIVTVGALLLHGRAWRRRRMSGWPNHLHRLLEPPPHWHGYDEAIAVVAATLLLLGVFQIVRGVGSSRLLILAGIAATTAGAVSCFYAAHRRWNANLFGLGASLMTLTAATLACLPLDPAARSDYAARTPLVLNAVLFAAAVMAFIWFWLPRLWQQQLDGRRAWTTAGRAIPYVHRTGFMVAALGTLIAFQLAMWPQWPRVFAPDNSPQRLLWGLAGILILALVMAREGRRSNAPHVAGLCVALLCAALLFVGVRWHNPQLRGWLVQYAAVAAAVAALPILALAEMLPKTPWRSFAPPLWFLALLVLPALALGQIAGPVRPAAPWVRPLTLAAVGGLYGLAGSREGRRAFLLLAALLLASALFTLYRNYGDIMMPSIRG